MSAAILNFNKSTMYSPKNIQARIKPLQSKHKFSEVI